VAFLPNRAGRTQVYVVPRNGGDARAVTSNPLGVSAFRWSPDGKEIAYRAREPGSEGDANGPHVADRPDDLERLWIVEVATGAVRQVTRGEVRIDEFEWLDSGHLLAIASDHPTEEVWNAGVFAISTHESKDTAAEMRVARPKQPFNGLTLSPHRKQWGVLSTDRGGPIAHDLFLQSVGSSEARNVTASLDRAVVETRWQDDSNVFVRIADGFHYRIVHIDSHNIAERVDLPYTVRAFDVARDGTLIFVGTDFNRLPELFLRRPRGAITQIGELQSGWAGIQLRDAEIFHFKSFDGSPIEAALMKPPAAGGGRPGVRSPTLHEPSSDAAPSASEAAPTPGTKAPLVVFAHGGPASSFTADYFWFNAWPQLLAARGYQVLLVNPRGSVGYGEKFLEANRADLGGGDFKDIMAAVDAVVARGEVDPERLGIGGWSYGAQMTQWAIGHTRRFKAAVSGQGVFDEAFEYYTEDDPAADEWYFGTPWEHPDVFARNSPSAFISNARTPTLIVHMEGDKVNPVSQSQALYRALKRMGVETVLVTYPEATHLPGQETHQVDVMKRMIDWYDRHLK
jgi:dipeptidyl aminopeptidase/acylaminoacyl peptidase